MAETKHIKKYIHQKGVSVTNFNSEQNTFSHKVQQHIPASCGSVCIVVVVLCVLLLSYVYLLYCVYCCFYFRCRATG